MLNSSILVSQGQDPEPKLPKLMGVLNWGEGVLAEKGGEWPKWDLREILLQSKQKEKEKEGETKEVEMSL